MKDDKDYYKAYPDEYGKRGYHMEQVAETSRVSMICDMITENLPEGRKILDIGCGDMYLSKLLPEYEWTGLDIHSKYNTDVVEHDIQVKPYPFKDGTFDAVVCSEVLEHLFFPLTVHEEARRLLNSKGVYIVSTPNMNHMDHFFTHFSEIEYDPSETHRVEHIRWYSRAKHEQLLESSGFWVEEVLGADAHFTKCMQDARHSLVKQGLAGTLFEADVILGKCFPTTSHTVILRARIRS